MPAPLRNFVLKFLSLFFLFYLPAFIKADEILLENYLTDIEIANTFEERKNGITRGPFSAENLIGGMTTESIIENGERVGYACVNIRTGEKGIMAHRNIDSRLRILGFGIDPTELDRVAVPAIMDSIGNCEILVIDEVGKFSVESEMFVSAVRTALNHDMPTLLTLHKKSRHPLLQDIRRRDDGRILEVTPVNRALLPYKIHKLVKEMY